MKKYPFIIGASMGAIIGMLLSWQDDVGVTVVMMCIGAIVGLAVFGALFQAGSEPRDAHKHDTSDGLGYLPEDRVQNFWRDKGKVVPFSGQEDGAESGNDFDR